jgi:hypothetical protein
VERRVLVVLLALAACEKARPAREFDLDRVRVTEARLRTDTVGDARFASEATFVLVDADNTSATGAYITLGGTLEDAGKQPVGELKAQSLWVPGNATRTFALVDVERKPRPTATAARIAVKGALVPDTAPVAHVDDVHEFDDYGKTVVQGMLVNDSDRPGEVMVISSFHDVDGRPMTRPFTMMKVDGKEHQAVQFVGPPGSTHGTIYVGDAIF